MEIRQLFQLQVQISAKTHMPCLLSVHKIINLQWHANGIFAHLYLRRGKQMIVQQNHTIAIYHRFHIQIQLLFFCNRL